MLQPTNQAYSNSVPIRKISSLAKVLNTSEEELIYVANHSESLWKQGKTKLKSDKVTLRITNDAMPRLKDIHEQIKNRLLKKASYPSYLQGGLCNDAQNRRGHIENATRHTDKLIIIEEDVRNFFPSVSKNIIHNIWQRFFNFHPDIAEILTNLTTYQESLPQGWKTSGYLANLVFWSVEPKLVNELQKEGYVYTRFIDDIVVSSSSLRNNSEKTRVIKKIYSMLFSHGVAPERNKHQIQYRGQNASVTGLNVNGKKPTISKAKRKNTKTMIYQLEQQHKDIRNSVEYEKAWNSASGHVAHMTNLHPNEAQKLRERLSLIRPAISRL